MTQELPAEFSAPSNILEITLALTVAATIAVAAALGVGRVARNLLGAVSGDDLAAQPLARRTLRVVKALTFVVLFLVIAFPALEFAGVQPSVGMDAEDLGRWATRTGVRIVALFLLAFIVVRILALVVERAERDLNRGTGLDALERLKRTQTIARLIRRTLSGLVWTTAALIVLRELDVDITPVLAGAGIIGLAVGFGAQTLVRDVITGIFLIMENQVRVGDVATVNGIGGLVERINLRTIVLRDLEGVVHVIPNGEIKTISNRTKDYSFYVVDLRVDYGTDVDRVATLIQEAGEELMADPNFAPSILAPIEILGVDDFKESAVILKFRIKTIPLKQWEVGRALRRRVKLALDREGIRVPRAQLDVSLDRSNT